MAGSEGKRGARGEGRRWGRRGGQDGQPEPGAGAESGADEGGLEQWLAQMREEDPAGAGDGADGGTGDEPREVVSGVAVTAAEARAGAAPQVRVDVFTGPESAFFSTSSLVHGPTEAVLVDTQLTRAAGRELAEWVAGKQRRLTAVVITHAHPDHYFGTEEILRLFPGTPVYAVPEVIEGIIATALAKVAEWQPVFGDDITSFPVVPGPLPGHRLRVDGAELVVLSLGQGDCAASSVVHVPAADTVIAGDLVYNGTHLWTAETTPAQRRDWLANLEVLRGLGASRLVAGHRAPEQGDDATRVLAFTGDYLREFDACLAEHPEDPAGLIGAMNRTYAELTLPVLLELSAAANAAGPVGPAVGGLDRDG